MNIKINRIINFNTSTFRQSGFSLIEVLVALTILMIVVVGVLGIFARSQSESTRAERIGLAMQMIASDEDVLRSLDKASNHAYHQMLAQIAAQAAGDAPMAQYYRASHATDIDCTQACTPKRYAQALALQTARLASERQILIGSMPCQTSQCWVIRWGASTDMTCQYLQNPASHATSGCLLVGARNDS